MRETLKVFYRADFCVGYFNLRSWWKIDDLIEQHIGGEGCCCRLLIGMQSFCLVIKFMRHSALALLKGVLIIVRSFARKNGWRRNFASITISAPTNQDEAGLRRLSHQLKAKKLIIKLFLRHSLHAKLYLAHRNDANTPTVGFLGSSNLTGDAIAY